MRGGLLWRRVAGVGGCDARRWRPSEIGNGAGAAGGGLRVAREGKGRGRRKQTERNERTGMICFLGSEWNDAQLGDSTTQTTTSSTLFPPSPASGNLSHSVTRGTSRWPITARGGCLGLHARAFLHIDVTCSHACSWPRSTLSVQSPRENPISALAVRSQQSQHRPRFTYTLYEYTRF